MAKLDETQMRKAQCGVRNDARSGWNILYSAFRIPNSEFIVTALLIVAVCPYAQADAPEKMTFDDHVAPIFREHCLACHDSGGKSGDLSLESYGDTMTGGASGKIVEPGVAGDSRLYQLMAHIETPVMPPGSDKLPDEQLNLVKAWIDGGLLENSGSKALKSKKPAVEAFVPSADNRPSGEPAMPGGFFREPVLRTETAGAVADVAASPWAPLIALTGQRQVLLYHADTRELLAALPFVVGQPQVVRFSRNGDLLMVGGGRGASLGVVHLWNIKTGERIAEVGDELDTILAADLLADHTLVAMGGPRKRVQVHRTADGSLAYSITKHTDWVTALEFSPDGQLLVTADRSGGVHLWEAVTGRPVAALNGHKAAITSVSWRGDSKLVVTASDDGDIRTWQPRGNQVKQWRAGPGVLDVSFTKDGRVVTVGRDRVARLYNTDGKELKKLGTGDDITLAIAATHDETKAVFTDWTGAVRLVNLESGEELGRLDANPPTLTMRLDAANNALAEIVPKIEPAEQALAAATMTLSGATEVVEKHKAAKQAATDALAKLEKARGEQQAQLELRKQEMDELNKALMTVVDEQHAAEAKLEELKQHLATVGNQQGEEADGKAAAEIEGKIAEQESALEGILAKREETAAKKSKLAESRKAARSSLDSLAGQLKEKREALKKLEAEEKSLPKIDALTAERDRLQQQLDAERQAKAAAEHNIAAIAAEIEAYAAAQVELEATFAQQESTVEAKTGELGKLEEQYAAEQAKVDEVAAELEALRKQMEKLEAKRKELATVASTAEQAASSLEAELAELSNEKAKVEKALSDFHATAELRKQFEPGN